jgi:hypothetical protein
MQGEGRVFARVTMVFGGAVLAVSGLAWVGGLSPTGAATIPAILGVLFILFGWLGRHATADRSARERSPLLVAIMLAGALVFSSTHGITLFLDALGKGTLPTASGLYLFGIVLAGIGYIAFSAWWDIAEAQRIASARAGAVVSRPSPTRSGRQVRAKRSRR